MHDSRCSKLIEGRGITFCRTKLLNLLTAKCRTKKNSRSWHNNDINSQRIHTARSLNYFFSCSVSVVECPNWRVGRTERESEKENIGRVARPVEPLESLDEGAGGWEITWTLVFGSTDRAVGKVPLAATN